MENSHFNVQMLTWLSPKTQTRWFLKVFPIRCTQSWEVGGGPESSVCSANARKFDTNRCCQYHHKSRSVLNYDHENPQPLQS